MVSHICDKCKKEITGLDIEWEPYEYFWHVGCSKK